MIKYPASIDDNTSLPPVNSSTRLVPNIFNNLREGILAIENELGAKPSSIYGTVRGRLDYLETQLKKAVLIGGDIGGTPNNPIVIGIQGNPISSSDPQINEVLVWNGTSWEPSPQTQLSPGNNYSDYAFWNPTTNSWLVGSNTIHLGSNAGLTGQGNYAVAIGFNAGCTSQGEYAIAIGANAVSSNQLDNSIVINASNIEIDASSTGLYISPIRDEDNLDNLQYSLYYNDSTKEIVKVNTNITPVNIVNTTTYNVVNTDYFIGANGGSTITLPLSPTIGQTHIIKDVSGSAGNTGNSIVIDGNSKLIDGASEKNLTIDYQSLTLIYNGTSWSSI